MRASTIDWIQHGNMPINSVDMQPKGFRILTGGNDNKVCIWNLLPIVKRQYEIKGLEHMSTEPNENGAKTNKLNEDSKIDVEIHDEQAKVSFGLLFG
jgi:WD40 repeat protein